MARSFIHPLSFTYSIYRIHEATERQINAKNVWTNLMAQVQMCMSLSNSFRKQGTFEEPTQLVGELALANCCADSHN